MSLKGDFINKAYSRARISGLTVQPTPEDLKLALHKLENMASMWADRNICAGYNFEETPDLNSLHNVDRKYWDAFESNLAAKLLTDFGMQPSMTLMAEQSASLSQIVASTAVVGRVQYPARMPRGSGSRYSYNRRFFPATEMVPIECETARMFIDDVNDFVENFGAYLNAGEIVSSYTIEADSGLTINSDSNTDTTVVYQITAPDNAGFYKVKIVVTTSDGRKETRIINFVIMDSSL